MTDAVAKAAEVPGAEVRRAVMLSGSLAMAAQAALVGGSDALREFGLQVGGRLADAGEQRGVDRRSARQDRRRRSGQSKLDGLRVPAQSRTASCGLFSRSLDDVTDRLPGVVTALARSPCTTPSSTGN